MKATYIAPIEFPPDLPAEIRKKIRVITPELLAAILAKYSRSNEGIDALLSKVNWEDPAKAVDAIFKFVDYGHASIGGLTGGIAIAVDQVSMILAYKLFEFAQMADGQESSTRYIQLDVGGLPTAEEVGIPKQLCGLWTDTCEEGFALYNKAHQALQSIVEQDPAQARIPDAVRSKPKVLDRMLKNYALDRARSFLPFACKTNIALVATARIWAEIVRMLESLGWPEAVAVAAAIRGQLKLAAPNLIRHSHPNYASISQVTELLQASQLAAAGGTIWKLPVKTLCRVEVFDPKPSFIHVNQNMDTVFQGKESRYSVIGTALRRQTVQTEWNAISIAELRDLNRHRTGHRYSDFKPVGFYYSPEIVEVLSAESRMDTTEGFFKKYEDLMRGIARSAMPGLHIYSYFLGTQVAFEHTQQADKFLYEVELRTGLGAHFRYAEHLRQAAELYFEKCPEVRKHIVIGEAEPE